MKKYSYLLIPFAAVLVSCLLLLTTLESKTADFFQRPLKSTPQSKGVMMINVDDAAVDEIGSWPFSRDVYADCLTVLRDLGAGGVVFDLSFLDKSPAKVDEDFVEKKLPDYIDSAFKNMRAGRSSAEDTKNDILINISHVIRKLDSYLADGLKFFGNSTLAITMVDFDQISDEEKQFLGDNIALKDITSKGDTKTPEFNCILPAIPELMKKTGSAGFVNADVDPDGYLRRLHLLAKYNGKYYGQLVFATILEYYGNPSVIVSNSAIVLENAVLEWNEDGSPKTKRNIRIPRSNDGSVLLKYPKALYNDYHQVSLWPVYRIIKLEESVKNFLDSMNEGGFLNYTEDNPLELYDAVAWLKGELAEGEDPENEITYENYSAYKQAYIDSITQALSEDTEAAILQDVAGDKELSDYVRESFTTYRATFEEYLTSRDKLAAMVKDTVCIIGTTATSTTDWGINQYEDHYPNPGAHYVLTNMLMARDFVDDSPVWLSVLAALIFAFAYSLLGKRIKGTGRQICAGVAAVFCTLTLLLIFFIVTRTYIGAVVPVSSVFITFVVTTVVGFLTASKDKKFITNAFSQCLSKEVVNEIVANPSSFKLGGQRLEMTAIFTDIQKFSGFSELLTASQLVALLNFYLTKMSDIIMEERGTVDKYEGDAIIALVGAPVKMSDHAERAVAASLKMKAAEEIMNQEILKTAAEEKPADMDADLYDAFTIMVKNNRSIFTRIGLNSGEMIAGYMGSENKKNYTMMGNNVNLASRLEGVNKQYSTGGILMSEATRNLCGDRFLVRRLDRVRVVNVNTPIRLYEPLAEKDSEKGRKLLPFVEKWEKAMDLFEAKDYSAALCEFKALKDERPEDKTAEYYIKLCENFFCKGKVPLESDGVGVQYEDDGVFKLLQK